ncbi:MAG: hypothetical protein ACKD6N_03795 [Candidatus Bathyarchaeota archaeon]
MAWVGPWPGRGPFSYLPPWQRPGWIFGFGRWLWGYPYPWVCARFPWLPRCWWAHLQYWYGYPYAGYAWPYMAPTWGFYGYPYWPSTFYMPYW